MSVMNLISKFVADRLGAGALAIVTPPVGAAVVELPGTDAGAAEFRAEGAVGESG
jgi:hypothetical protein